MHSQDSRIRSIGIAVAALALLALACQGLPVGRRGGTSTPFVPTPTATAVPSGALVTMTPTAAPTYTLQPTYTPPPTYTPRSTLPPTSTPFPTATPLPTSTALPPATATALAQPLAIVAFSADIADVSEAKQLTFKWQTTGADKVRIVSGTAQRFPQWWEQPPNGTLSVYVDNTYYPNPPMTLIAYDKQGNSISRAVNVSWPCKYAYFFQSVPRNCPFYQPARSPAAEQQFERGRALWFEEVEMPDTSIQGPILVLYDDGSWARFQDTWAEGQPESDPNVVPPTGRLQPIRGFGKLWRENLDVQQKLGWALAPERGYEGVWQQQARESVPDVFFVLTIDNQVLELQGFDTGTWKQIQEQ